MIAAEKNPKIKKARAILVKLSEDERTRMLAEAEEKARWDREACLLTAQMEGYAKGHVEGRAEGAASVIRLLSVGVPLNEIRRRLGL